jgi:hypothetical protein
MFIELLLALVYSPAHAQQATEQYIPIGQSPGVSGKSSLIGVIVEVDAATKTVTVGERTVRITERTFIWLDRTKLKLTNLTGKFEDLQKGRRVEVKFQAGVAEWVKIEAK